MSEQVVQKWRQRATLRSSCIQNEGLRNERLLIRSDFHDLATIQQKLSSSIVEQYHGLKSNVYGAALSTEMMFSGANVSER